MHSRETPAHRLASPQRAFIRDTLFFQGASCMRDTRNTQGECPQGLLEATPSSLVYGRSCGSNTLAGRWNAYWGKGSCFGTEQSRHFCSRPCWETALWKLGPISTKYRLLLARVNGVPLGMPTRAQFLADTVSRAAGLPRARAQGRSKVLSLF